MTTDTQHNTVFLVAPAVKARCEEGETIFKTWVQRYNAAVKESGDRWQIVLYKEYMKFFNHAVNCPACLEYEQSRGRLEAK